MKNTIRLVYIVLTALLIWFGLILQFYISIEKYMSQGRLFINSFIQVFSFFTIQSNLLAAIVLTAVFLKPGKWKSYFSRVSVITAVTVYMAIVGLIYEVILRGIWQPQGLFKLTDDILHVASPILFVLFWLLFVPRGNIQWKELLLWAIFPLCYLVYSLIRGYFTHDYPYDFINADKLSYPQIAINSFFVLVAFLVISAVFIGISRLFKK